MIARRSAVPPWERIEPSRLGRILTASGVLTPETLRTLECRAAQRGMRLSETILEAGAATESQVAQALALLYGLETARFDQCPLDARAISSIPEEVARNLQVVPLRRVGSHLACAIFDPGNLGALETLENLAECTLSLQIATPTEIRAELDRRYSVEGTGPRQQLPIGPGDMFLHYRLGAVRWEEPGVVLFEADDTRLLRRVCVALVCPDLSDPMASRAARFLEHTLWLARLPHPNILTIHDVGEGDGLRFAVSEAIDGETLRERLHRERRLSWASTLAIALHLCDALHHIHRHHLVYRVLSPGNCVLVGSDQTKLTHLGLGFETGEVGDDTLLLDAEAFRYRAPEHLRNEPLDPRADIFSLGAMLYEMASGLPAFPAAGVAGVTRLILEGGLAPCEELPPALNRIILRACALERHVRYRDAPTMAEDLRTQELADRVSEVA